MVEAETAAEAAATLASVAAALAFCRLDEVEPMAELLLVVAAVDAAAMAGGVENELAAAAQPSALAW